MLRILAHKIDLRRVKLQVIEREVALDLARRLEIPSDAIVVKARPVLQVELKVPLTSKQMACLEEIIGQVKGFPAVNTRPTSGLN